MSVTNVPPAAVAAATAAAKGYLRLSSDEEAGVLAACAGAALSLAEAYCGQLLVRRAVEDVVGGEGGGWQALRHGPVASIGGATGLPAAGAPFVLPVESYGYDIDADGTGWVRLLQPGAAPRVAVSYVAGLAAEWDGLPLPVAQGVAMLAAHLFEARGQDAAPPAAITALWRPWRRLGLGLGLGLERRP